MACNCLAGAPHPRPRFYLNPDLFLIPPVAFGVYALTFVVYTCAGVLSRRRFMCCTTLLALCFLRSCPSCLSLVPLPFSFCFPSPFFCGMVERDLIVPRCVLRTAGNPTPASLARGVGEGAIAAVGNVAGRVEGLASGAKGMATSAAVAMLPSFLTRAAGVGKAAQPSTGDEEEEEDISASSRAAEYSNCAFLISLVSLASPHAPRARVRRACVWRTGRNRSACRLRSLFLLDGLSSGRL